MRVKTSHIIAGSLLAAAVWLTPTLSHAQQTLGQFIVAECRDVVASIAPNNEPDCFGKCVSFLNVCVDKKTGNFQDSALCDKKLLQLIEACPFDQGGE